MSDTKTIFTQLVAAQPMFKSAIKDSTNPHFKSRYADLASIWDACKDGLSKNGLFVTQTTEVAESGQITLTTRIFNEKGESIHSHFPVICANMGNPQAVGSALTYARRYSLAAILGIITDDDDANEASPKPQQAESNNGTHAEEDNREWLSDKQCEQAAAKIREGNREIYSKTLGAFKVNKKHREILSEALKQLA